MKLSKAVSVPNKDNRETIFVIADNTTVYTSNINVVFTTMYENQPIVKEFNIQYGIQFIDVVTIDGHTIKLHTFQKDEKKAETIFGDKNFTVSDIHTISVDSELVCIRKYVNEVTKETTYKFVYFY